MALLKVSTLVRGQRETEKATTQTTIWVMPPMDQTKACSRHLGYISNQNR